MSSIPIEQVKDSLSALIDKLHPGEVVIITRQQQPVARLSKESLQPRRARQPGNCQGMLTILVDDDEHLQDFQEYM